MYSAEAREMVCYACIFGLDDSKPSEKSEGMCLHFKYFSDSFDKKFRDWENLSKMSK